MSERTEHEAAPLRPVLCDRLVVVGLGLVGGSIARALRRASPSTHIAAVDREVILKVATDEGLVDEGAPAGAADALLREADLVVLCLPMGAMLTFIEEHHEALGHKAVLTDTGSTKGAVEALANTLKLSRFVGGHPMAGKPHAGLAHADAELFAGATWFVCPPPGADADAVHLVRRFVRELGAAAVEIDAGEHDLAVALTSHLPHVLVNALCEAVIDEGVIEAAGGSLRQLSQIAGAPVNTWKDTLRTNAPAVAASLKRFASKLEQVADQLDDEERLNELFNRGRACRERLGAQSTRPPRTQPPTDAT
jgi:prephenate dehydrogenase